MDEPKTITEKHERHLLRGLRPLLWWIVFVLLLFAMHTHQRLSEKTHLNFSIWLQGQEVTGAILPEMDAQGLTSGSRVSVGWHKLAISNPKIEPFLTNLFIWYGANNLGEITLKRGTGLLAINVNPPARFFSITGSEFRMTLTNSAGVTSFVPTDTYIMEADYAHWQARQEVAVFCGSTNVREIASKLGATDLACNQPGATFELSGFGGRVAESGKFPATIVELPVGNYTLTAQHHRNRKAETVTVKPSATNDLRVEFMYGTAVLETDPVGAMVSTDDGLDWGVTPVKLTELRPGTWQFNLRNQGYEPVVVSFLVAANETNILRTNLVSRSYVMAMDAAGKYLTAADYDRALEAANDALRAKPDDTGATTLQRQALGFGSIQRAEALAKQENYTAAITKLEVALKALPENEQAQKLLVEFKKKESQQAQDTERREAVAKRERRPRDLFNQRMKNTMNSELFDQKEIKLKGNLADIEAKLVRAVTNEKPTFKLLAQEHPDPETFFISASHGMGLGGRRRVDLVGGQTADTEVTILFKVFEYALPVQSTFRALVGKAEDKDMVPIHASRLGEGDSFLLGRREEGIRLIRERIRVAIGE